MCLLNNRQEEGEEEGYMSGLLCASRHPVFGPVHAR